MELPKRIQIGGQTIEVTQPKDIEGGKLGKVCLGNGLMKIAQTFDGMEQSETSKRNTFWHEVVHGILDTMGRSDLSGDEPFVCCFSSFLTECINSFDWTDEHGAAVPHP